MKAVVLAAGRGTRMRPLTDTRPKPLLPVAGRPLIEHVLDAARDAVDGYVIVVGYRQDDVRDHIGSTYREAPVEYVEQPEPAGTGDAIGRAADVVDERFVVLNGDVLVPPSIVEDVAAASAGAIAVRPVDDPSQYGIVDVDGDAVSGIVEKPDDPPSDVANLGIYGFEPAVFDYIADTEPADDGEIRITDTIRMMLDDGHRFVAVEHEGRWLDVGRPWELLEANERVLEDVERSIDGAVHDDAVLDGEIVVEEGAEVRAGSVLRGPVVVASGATVGPNAYVRDGTVVGEDAHVGHAVEVKNSVLFEGATAAHLSYVGDSVIGSDVNLGAGTTVANLRHDDGSVAMTVKGERVDTGRRKLGVVLGDRAKTGIQTSLNAGVKLGVAATTEPGETVVRDVEGEA